MARERVLLVMGTRPEAIKMCPLVKALEADGRFERLVCVTGQHRELLAQALDAFSVGADYDLAVMRPQQSLTDVTTRVLTGMASVLEDARPSLVLVHGDTTTTLAAALASFYGRVPVGHVEAGLRTETIHTPFPEEANRRLVTRLAALHFAPTSRAADNLAQEGVREGVFVTGNTVIDALRHTVRGGYRFHAQALGSLDLDGRLVLVTAHRRENLGRPLDNICGATLALAQAHPGVRFVFPVHPNPAVTGTVRRLLGGRANILLTDPLDVTDLHNLLARCRLVLTDSGGLQEEAPALGVPVVVLRAETERPEAVESGAAVLAGVEQDAIFRAADRLLTDEAAHAAMRGAGSPYGDGHASERIAGHIGVFLGKERQRLPSGPFPSGR